MASTTPVDDFINKVKNLYEVDHGDFKRKVNLYLIRMEEALAGQPVPGLMTDFSQRVRATIMYQGGGDLEIARTETLNLAAEFKSQQAVSL